MPLLSIVSVLRWHFALQVNLLETKRSMNANIFLKQFKASNEEVVQMVKEGQQARIGAERLRGLQKIMPEKEEVREVVDV